jgi:hypothetical protein
MKHQETNPTQPPSSESTSNPTATQSQPRRRIIRFAIPRPIFIDAVHPFDTIDRYISRKFTYGPSLTLSGLVLGLSLVALGVFIFERFEKRHASTFENVFSFQP